MNHERLHELIDALPVEGEAFDEAARKLFFVALAQGLDFAYGRNGATVKSIDELRDSARPRGKTRGEAKRCEFCSKSFEPSRHTHRFCSVGCRNKFNTGKRSARDKPRVRAQLPPRKCETCGDEFQPSTSNNKTCSVKCLQERIKKRDRDRKAVARGTAKTLTLGQAAKRLGVSEQTLSIAMAKNEIEYKSQAIGGGGREVNISTDEVERILRERAS